MCDNNTTRPKLCAMSLVIEATAVLIRCSLPLAKIAAEDTVSCEIACEKHVAQLLQTLSLLTTEHANSSLMGQPFLKLVTSSGGAQQQSPG